MKTLLTLCFASALTLAARADTFTFTPSNPDIGDLDHHYAYSWGITWNLPTDQKIVGATLTIKNIWDWRYETTDMLFIDLLDNTGTGLKSFLDNTNDNVTADYFAGQGVTLKQWSDPYGGYARNFNLVVPFSTTQLDALTTYINDGHSTGQADFGISFDPDCHYFNDGVSLTIKTERVPEGGATIVLMGLGLVAISSLRRFFRS